MKRIQQLLPHWFYDILVKTPKGERNSLVRKYIYLGIVAGSKTTAYIPEEKLEFMARKVLGE